MTKQMNEMALVANGYKIVATYKKFEKDCLNNWTVHKAVCFQKEKECVIKLHNSSKKKSFTLCYQNKDEANAKIKQLISMGYKRSKDDN